MKQRNGARPPLLSMLLYTPQETAIHAPARVRSHWICHPTASSYSAIDFITLPCVALFRSLPLLFIITAIAAARPFGCLLHTL